MRAMLSMLPMMKYAPSGDQARSYISAPLDRHMCFVRHVSLSSNPSDPKAAAWRWFSAGTQRMTFPSSPAEARSSPAKSQYVSCGPVQGRRMSVVRFLTYLWAPNGQHLLPVYAWTGSTDIPPFGLHPHPLSSRATLTLATLLLS